MAQAALDIGTNTLRVLIKEGDSYIFRKNYYLFLGNEVIGGKLSYQGIKKLDRALEEINQIFLENNVKEVYSVATAFARKLNCEKELKDIFFRYLGIDIKVIDGEEEGLIVYNSVKNHYKLTSFSLLDIGGGSTEIVYNQGKDIKVTSLDIGSLYLKKQFFKNFPPLTEEKNELCNYVLYKLSGSVDKHITQPVFGVGGTVTTVAFLLSSIKKYDKNLINGFEININSLERFYHSIEYMDLKKIRDTYPIEEGREEVLLSGVLLILLLMNYFNLPSITASDTSLLEGLFFLPTRRSDFSRSDR